MSDRNDAAVHREAMLAAVPSLRAFAISLCGDIDRADDLVQETLLRAIANIDSFEPGTNMSAWMFTILRNLFRSEYRKRRREVEDADGAYAESLSRTPTEQPPRIPGIPRGAAEAAARSARSAHPGRRVRLLLRRGRERSATARSARSRAASTVRAPALPICSQLKARKTSVPTNRPARSLPPAEAAADVLLATRLKRPAFAGRFCFSQRMHT